MKLLEDAILSRGKVLPGEVLSVGSFLNNQIDTKLISELGKDIFNHFKDKNVTKILTIEASGIAIACFAAYYFGCDFVFAKKSKTINVSGDVYTSKCFSYTHKTENTIIVPKNYLSKDDNILIIDDFLARGEALNSLIDIVKQSGASIVGASVAIEKGFQGGGDKLRSQGYDVYSLALIESMTDSSLTFRK